MHSISGNYMHGVFTIAEGKLVMRLPRRDEDAMVREVEYSMAMAAETPDYDDFCITWDHYSVEGDNLSGFNLCKTSFEGFSLAAVYNYHDPSGMDGFATPVTPLMAEKFHQFAEKLVAQIWSHGDISADNIFWDTRRECFRIARWQTFDSMGADKEQDIEILSRIEAVLHEWYVRAQ